MRSGRNNQLTKQVGEYLVACELARRGLLVATFSGNVPDFDLIATNFHGFSCPIQVKTVKGGAWQFSIDKFVEIIFNDKQQIIGRKKPIPIPRLVGVFVVAGENYGGDKFFVIEWRKVQDILIAHHARFLDSHGGVRPKAWDSLHCSLETTELKDYRDNWSIITAMRPARS
jgi:hypothetical protein